MRRILLVIRYVHILCYAVCYEAVCVLIPVILLLCVNSVSAVTTKMSAAHQRTSLENYTGYRAR